MFVDDYQISQFIYKGYSVCIWITDFKIFLSGRRGGGSYTHGQIPWYNLVTNAFCHIAKRCIFTSIQPGPVRTCERPGQVNNLALLKTDILSSFSPQRQGWRTIKPSPGTRSKFRCLSLLWNDFNSYATL
jgi:hypothetical protein